MEAVVAWVELEAVRVEVRRGWCYKNAFVWGSCSTGGVPIIDLHFLIVWSAYNDSAIQQKVDQSECAV